MAMDPYIARGVQPIDVSNSLREIAVLKQRDQELEMRGQERNALMQDRQREQQAGMDQQRVYAEMEKIKAHLESGDPKGSVMRDPEAMQRMQQQGIDINAMPPEQVAQRLVAAFGQFRAYVSKGPPELKAPEKPGQLYSTEEGYLTADEARGKMPYQAPRQGPAPEGVPADQRMFQWYASLTPEQRKQFDAMKGRNAGAGGGMTVDPETGAVTVPTGKTNDVMRTASGFVSRMGAAEKLLGDYSPTTRDYIAATEVMTSGPVMASMANKVLSEPGQRYYQAASDWVRAKLRKESGAVIGPEEMQQEIKTYFPVPGDSAAVVAHKKQARAQATEALKTQAAGAFTPEAPDASAPKAGDNVKGYIFIGGDPAKKENWVKAR
jgi:hypothetical protein